MPGDGGVDPSLFKGSWVENITLALKSAELTLPVGACLHRGTYEGSFRSDVIWYNFPLARKVEVLIKFGREGVMRKVADFLQC